MTQLKTLRDSAALRWTALLLLALAMFCAYIFMDILSPIKDLMLSERGWDSTAFGTMQGSETFLNVFVFFLIFAGIILDKMGVRFTALLSGAVITETIFSINGIGRLAVQAISGRDIPLLQGTVLFSTAVVILGNLGADLLYTVLDPRIRKGGGPQ